MPLKNTLLTHMGVATCAVAVLLTGCATATQEQKGAGTGAVIGAVAGQILGRDSKSTAIGAGLGALGGYIWSKQMEDKKRAMEQATAGTGTVVSQTADNQLKLSIPNDISFATGRHDIQPRRLPSWMMAPTGAVGGFLDAAGGGGCRLRHGLLHFLRYGGGGCRNHLCKRFQTYGEQT